jgi:hypothetical protein
VLGVVKADDAVRSGSGVRAAGSWRLEGRIRAHFGFLNGSVAVENLGADVSGRGELFAVSTRSDASDNWAVSESGPSSPSPVLVGVIDSEAPGGLDRDLLRFFDNLLPKLGILMA